MWTTKQNTILRALCFLLFQRRDSNPRYFASGLFSLCNFSIEYLYTLGTYPLFCFIPQDRSSLLCFVAQYRRPAEALTCVAVLFFSNFILNIFIGVIGAEYEKDDNILSYAMTYYYIISYAIYYMTITNIMMLPLVSLLLLLVVVVVVRVRKGEGPRERHLPARARPELPELPPARISYIYIYIYMHLYIYLSLYISLSIYIYIHIVCTCLGV